MLDTAKSKHVMERRCLGSGLHLLALNALGKGPNALCQVPKHSCVPANIFPSIGGLPVYYISVSFRLFRYLRLLDLWNNDRFDLWAFR